jgi:nicotinamidase/pyrazinamidase
VIVMRALVLVDIQNDFLPGGALAVPNGDQVVPVANKLMKEIDLVVATQDWHPADHGSFAANHPGRQPGDVIDLHGLRQVLWPVHCVQGTPGAEFAPGLDVSRIKRVFQKGTDPDIDSYSGFFDNGHRRSTGLGDYLLEQHVSQVLVMGLATDYCVKFTALDSIQRLGFTTYVIRDGSRGVNLRPGDTDRAYEKMTQSKVGICHSDELPWER